MSRGKPLSCSAGLLLCLLQLTVVLLQQTCAAKQTCPPSSCGKITNITHPFRLKDDPENCGDRRYELACENNMTVLPLLSGKYYVKAINYHNFTVRLVDPSIQDADCSSIPCYSLSSSNFTDFYNYSRENNADPYQVTQYRFGDDLYTVFQHVIYLNCSNPVRDDPQYVDTAPCVNWHSKGHFYAIAGDLLVGNLKADCQMKLVAATSFLGLKGIRDKPLIYNQTFSYAEIHRMLVYGFDVSWMDRACEDQCGKGVSCAFGRTSEHLHSGTPICLTFSGKKNRCSRSVEE